VRASVEAGRAGTESKTGIAQGTAPYANPELIALTDSASRTPGIGKSSPRNEFVFSA
jgi:hypothetical protein